MLGIGITATGGVIATTVVTVTGIPDQCAPVYDTVSDSAGQDLINASSETPIDLANKKLQRVSDSIADPDKKVLDQNISGDVKDATAEAIDKNTTSIMVSYEDIRVIVENARPNTEVKIHLIGSDKETENALHGTIFISELGKLDMPAGGGVPPYLTPLELEALKLLRANIKTNKRLELVERIIETLQNNGAKEQLINRWLKFWRICDFWTKMKRN